MGSTRLPGKVLMPIAGMPLLEHVIARLERLHHAATIVVATSKLGRDSAISDWCQLYNIECFRGSEDDVLDRYLSCATHYGFDTIVRLTADNPFTDIAELDRLLDFHNNCGNDYTHSFGMMPIGVGAEVFSLSALRRSHAEGHGVHHREHVNEYIPEHPELFRIGVLDVPKEKQSADLRLTVDTEEDWKRACKLAELASNHWLGTEEAIALCSHSV